MKLKILHIKEASTNLIHFLSTQYYTSSFFFIFFAASFVTILHVKVRYLFPRVKKKKIQFVNDRLRKDLRVLIFTKLDFLLLLMMTYS